MYAADIPPSSHLFKAEPASFHALAAGGGPGGIVDHPIQINKHLSLAILILGGGLDAIRRGIP